MNRCARYEAFIPPEPEGLEIARDKDGDVWQRRESGAWSCARNKVPGHFFEFNIADWRRLVLDFGPIYPVEWSVGAEGEQSGAPDAGEPHHSGG